MDSARAQEIIESKGVIEVLYNSIPVWINSVTGESAEITYLDSNRKSQVPVASLNEGFKSF